MLRLVPPQQLHEVWGWVRNGLIVAAKRGGGHHLPEDVYGAIKAGVSHLFAVESKGDDVGFIVFQRLADADGPVLFVFALWLEPEAGRPIEQAMYAAVERKAREIGAVRIRMQSAREGWKRRPFFVPVATIYEYEVK
jgi:hypothetical protein